MAGRGWWASGWFGSLGSAPTPAGAPTLSIADNQDGTGATATLGDTGGAAVTVYTQIGAPPSAAPAWAAVASRTGDGALTLAGLGYFWAYAALSGGPPSPVVWFAATASNQSLYDRILGAVAAKIKTLTLTGPPPRNQNLPASHVMVQPVLSRLTAPSFPAVSIARPEGSPEQVRPIVNARDDIGYAVLVSIIDSTSRLDVGSEPAYALWRERIFRGLRHQRLPGIQECYTLEPAPEAEAAWIGGAYQGLVSAVGFHAWCRETRGI